MEDFVGVFSQDFIIRLVKQVVDAIARMARLRDKRDFAAALRQAEDAYDLLGLPADLAVAVDTETLVNLLQRPDKMRLMARLSVAEAEVFEASGDPLTSAARYRRAAELLLEAHHQEPAPDDAGELQEIMRHVHPGTLAPRYRDAITD